MPLNKEGYTMSGEDDYIFSKQKAKLQIGLGCFFGVIVLGLLVIAIPIWLFISISDNEEQLKVGHSPNNINTIEVVVKNEFPHQLSTIIKYDNKSITKTNRPDKVSIEWHNDYEADVIFIKQSRDPEIVTVEFK